MSKRAELADVVGGILSGVPVLFLNHVAVPGSRGVHLVTTDNGWKTPGSQTLWHVVISNSSLGIKEVDRAAALMASLRVSSAVVVSESIPTKKAISYGAGLNVSFETPASLKKLFAAQAPAAEEHVEEELAAPDVPDTDPGLTSDLEQQQLSEAIDLLGRLHALDRKDKLSANYSVTWEDNGRNHLLGNPYPWQEKFHAASAYAKERGLVAANRVGKTQCAAAEVAIHMTGRYPKWWKGRRFLTPIRVWVGSDTNETSRDIVQAALIGDEVGTGWIPSDAILNVDNRQCGLTGVADSVSVRHASGGVSKVVFKTYEQGRKKWQGTSQHLIWLDEEPPHDVYTEALTRTLDCQGLVMLTFTPLNGASSVVMHLLDGGNGIFSITVGWDDAPHLSEEDKAQMLASYPEWERETRTQGVPLSGSGAVYPVPDDLIMCDQFEIPEHYKRICGIDFGIDHPAAAAWIAYDADADIIYVYDCYKMRGETPAYHVEAIKRRGDWIPVVWPHDGMQREKSSGEPLANDYRKKGLNMMHPESARYDDESGGPQPTEPVVLDIDERMRTGRFKVFSHLAEWFREKRMYHRKDAQIVRSNDDIMSAMHYAVMMKRFARGRHRRIMPSVTTSYDPFSYITGTIHGA